MDASYLILIVAFGALALIAQRGCLRPDALDRGPSRTVGFILPDILVAFGLMLVGGSVGQLLMRSGLVGELPQEGQDLSTATVGLQVLLAQATGQLPPVLYFLIRAMWHRRGLRRVGVIPRRPLRDLRWGVLGLLAGVPLVMGSIMVIQLISLWLGHETPAVGHDMLNMLIDSDSALGSALIILSAVLIAPVLEEAIFRGLLQSVLVEWFGPSMRWGVVLVAAMLFALVHISAVPEGAEVQVLFGLFVFGGVLGWLYERTGSLWPSIMVHIGFNALNVIVALSTAVPAQATP